MVISPNETWYNVSGFINETDFVGMIKAANSYTNNLFGTLILIGFFIVLLIVLMKYEMKHRITVAAWTTGVIGMLYMPLGILSGWVVVLIVFVFTLGFIGLFWGD